MEGQVYGLGRAPDPQGAERPTYWLSSVVKYEPWLMMPAVNNPQNLDFAERVMSPFVQLDNLTVTTFPCVEKEKAGTASLWHRDIGTLTTLFATTSPD